MAMGTTAYGLLAGLSAGIGLLFLVMGLRKGWRVSTELTVGMLALAAAGQTLATLALHASETANDYEAILHGPFSYLGMATLVAVTWTVGAKEGLWYPRFPLAITGFAMIAMALDALVPGALIVDNVTALRQVHLFGEPFVVHQPAPSSLQFVLLGILLLIAGYIGTAMLVRWRTDKQMADAFSVGIAVAGLVASYDLLVDEGLVGTTYLQPFGLVALVFGLAIQHAKTVTRTEDRLIHQSVTLENLVASRTAALHAAHDDVLAQLGVRNKSAMRLAKLSEMFLTLSTVSLADDDVDDALTEAIGCLGRLCDASDAVLTWRHAGIEGGADMSVKWVEPHSGAAHGGDQIETIYSTLRGGGNVFGQIAVRFKDADGISGEHRRLVDLTADHLASVLLRLELESTRMSSAVDYERHRIARELHDSLSQRLYAAAFYADAISESKGSDPDFASKGAAKIRELVLSTLAEVRTLLYELQPEVLNDLMLTELVAQLCDSVTEIYQQPLELAVAHSGPAIPTGVKLALYRIVQEAMGNALRHSGATSINVAVDVDRDRASIGVVDDGVGYETAEVPTGHGLRNIRERAAEAGIALDITSCLGSGTTVSATWSRLRADTLDLTETPRLEVAS